MLTEMTVSILPSWRLSGVGILANKARGPLGPRALLASIPTPLNLQLGNIGSIFQLIIRKDQKPLLQPTNTSSIPQSILQSQLSWPYMFSQSVNIFCFTQYDFSLDFSTLKCRKIQ